MIGRGYARNALKIIPVICGLLGFAPIGFAKETIPFLKFDHIGHSLRSRTNGVYGMYLAAPNVYTFHDRVDYIYQTSYDKTADRTMAFSDIPFGFAKGEKVPLGKKVGSGRWIGRIDNGDKGFFLIDARMRLVAFDPDMKFVRETSIVLDKLEPPRDSRGEPTRYELAAFRRRVTKMYDSQPANARIATGITPRPETWPDADGAQYLMATRLPGFAVVTTKCDPDNWGQCHIVRGCFLSGKYKVAPENVAGIAVSRKRNLLLVGDTKYNRILVYDYKSCYHIVLKDVIHLPDRLEKVASLMVDDDDQLWVGTEKQDMFLNASLYIWPSEAW